MNLRHGLKTFWDSAVKEAGSSFVKGCIALVPMIAIGLFWHDKSQETSKALPTAPSGYFVIEKYHPGYVETDTYNPGRAVSPKRKIRAEISAPDNGYDVAAPDRGYDVAAPDYSTKPKTFNNFSPDR